MTCICNTGEGWLHGELKVNQVPEEARRAKSSLPPVLNRDTAHCE
ncbi:MAG: hypothetical protein ACXVIK_09450 [Halobacteriota archaeon]